MPILSTLKDHLKESQLYLNRTVTATVIVLSLSLVLLSRLVYLQIIEHDLYTGLSRNNQVRVVPIAPTRGLIYDRDGELIAENIPGFSLEIIPEQVYNLDKTVNALKEILSLTPSEITAFHRQVRYKGRQESIPLRIKLSEMDVAAFAIEKYRFPGVEVVARLIRHYRQPELFAHALGYVGPISERDLTQIDTANYRGTYHLGKLGLEKFYEDELHGKAGFQHIETDAKGRIIRILEETPPVSGTTLYVSLDSKLQKVAFEALKGERGAVVALDPNTGDVLTLVSTPSYDPNLFVQGIPVGTYRDLQDSLERPLFNRAIRGQYPPASTVKPLVALKGLEMGVTNAHFRIFDPGWFQLNNEGRFYRDWYRHGHGWTDLDKAIKESCDTYFWQLGLKVGITQLHEVFTHFGLGKPTGLDIVHEASGLVPSIEWKRRVKNEPWYPGETLNIVIGQGDIMTTPLQMAQVAASIANRGGRFQPRLVVAKAQTGSPLVPLPPTALEKIEMTPAHWDIVIQAMKKVIHSPGGTAHYISHGIRYEMAGKTGTAQVFSLKQNQKYNKHTVKAHLRDHGWFIAFAPADKPEIAIAVLVENNSSASKKIARQVLDAYFHPAASSEVIQLEKPEPKPEINTETEPQAPLGAE